MFIIKTKIIFGKEYSDWTIDKDLHDYILRTRYKTFNSINKLERYNSDNLFELHGVINDSDIEKFKTFLSYPIYISYIHNNKDYFDKKYNISNSEFLLCILLDETAIGYLFKEHISILLLDEIKDNVLDLDINTFIADRMDSKTLLNAYNNIIDSQEINSEYNIVIKDFLDRILENLINENF